MKLLLAKLKWFVDGIKIVSNGKNKKFAEKYKEVKDRYLFLDKQTRKEEAYRIAKAEYELISYIKECLKD